MRRAERLFRLVNEMRTRGISRANELAEHLEVSISTIYRDIAHLQASGLPIEGEAGVGYILRPGFDLPNVTFTHDQIDALAMGLAFVERTGDPQLATAAREARAKIQASLPLPKERRLADAPYFSLQSQKHSAPEITLLREAIRVRLVLSFNYQDGTGKLSERCVRPLALWNLSNGWMFSAWCELRKDFRTFRLDRVHELSATGQVFAEEEDKGLQAFLKQDQCD